MGPGNWTPYWQINGVAKWRIRPVCLRTPVCECTLNFQLICPFPGINYLVGLLNGRVMGKGSVKGPEWPHKFTI